MTADRILSWTPKAVVFDCDGTLMDTERHWVEARRLVLREYGVTPDEEFSERAKGIHYTDCGRLLAETAGRPELADKMTDQLLESFRSLVAEDPVTSPGAAALVALVHEFAPLAVASNCPRDVVETCLDTAGLLLYFDHVVVPGEGMRPKPHPDVYLAAARATGTDPAACLAVEDSLVGVQSAVRAGMRVVGVGPRPDEESLALTDLWVDTLEDPRLLAWGESRPPIPEGRAAARVVPPRDAPAGGPTRPRGASPGAGGA
ncbi:HAD family hydrolase [Streptomyces zingiberis]|uniref:HAD family phosphatase n=1 Tax=Streptomyces zingiberis TaxID=2053010 RepID=A0ABX1BV65_9ACTN|nr:HAD family phosphatase [Streptomyces zingiberis]NJQ01590.1 HAD family phosphatase [Streptomyces zingiberis]